MIQTQQRMSDFWGETVLPKAVIHEMNSKLCFTY